MILYRVGILVPVYEVCCSHTRTSIIWGTRKLNDIKRVVSSYFVCCTAVVLIHIVFYHMVDDIYEVLGRIACAG